MFEVGGYGKESGGSPGFSRCGGYRMEDHPGRRKRRGDFGGREKQSGSGDFGLRNPQPEDRAGGMLGGMNSAVHAQDLLRSGNAGIIDELPAEVGVPGAPLCSGKRRQ